MRFLTLLFAAAASASVIDVRVTVDEQGALTPIISTLPSRCYWSGTAPTCEGECSSGETYCGRNGCGDGKCCASGWKVLCCRGDCPSEGIMGQFERVMREANQKHIEMK